VILTTLTTAAAIAFGQTGGNILPFTVTIGAHGAVTASARIRAKPRIDAATQARLERLAKLVRFAALPARTACTGTLPDIASGWIRMDGRTAQVHGGCSPRFSLRYKALLAAVTAP
jgi:hypothetical protein